MSSNALSLDQLLDFGSDVAKAAINNDRGSEDRFWNKLKVLMSTRKMDFEAALPTFIQIISQFGDLNAVPPDLLSALSMFARALNDTIWELDRLEEFPDLWTVPIMVYRARHRNLRSQWNKLVVLALQAARIRTEGTMNLTDAVLLLSQNTGMGWQDQLDGGVEP